MTRNQPNLRINLGLFGTPFEQELVPEHHPDEHIGWAPWCEFCCELRSWVYKKCHMELKPWEDEENSPKGNRKKSKYYKTFSTC